MKRKARGSGRSSEGKPVTRYYARRIIRVGYLILMVDHEQEGGFVVSLTGKPGRPGQPRTRVEVSFEKPRRKR